MIALGHHPAPPYPGDDVYDVNVIYDEESSDTESDEEPVKPPEPSTSFPFVFLINLLAPVAHSNAKDALSPRSKVLDMHRRTL